MKKLTAQYRVIGGVFCLFFLGSITQAQDDGTIITTSEEPVVVIDSYEAALDENTKQSDLNIGEAVEPDFFNDIVDRIRGIFTNDDGSVEIGFLGGVFKSDTPALRIDQEGDAILQGDLTARTVRSAGDLTVGSPEEVSNTEGKAITVGDKDRGVIELHGGDGQEIIGKGMVQVGDFGMEIGTLTDQALKLFTNQAERVTITANGDVGIGIPSTTNPTVRLEVGGDIKATDTITAQSIDTSTISTDTVTADTITASSFIGDGSQLTGIEGKFVDGTSATDAVFTTGNVGIGTMDPKVTFEIAGDTPYMRMKSKSNSETSIGFTNSSNWVVSGIGHDFYSGKLFFAQGGGASLSNTKMVIDSAGNVGIGTMSPSTKLEVDGSITASSFIGDGSQLTGVSAGGKFVNGDTETNAVFTTGNVGIGTTDPRTQLQVAGEGDTGIIISSTGPRDDRDAEIGFENDEILWKLSNDDSYGNKKGFHVYNHPRNADGTFDSASSVMYLEANGNVGIGTTDPRTQLQVAGEGDTSILISSTGPRDDRDAEIGFENDEILWKLSNDDSYGNKKGFHVYNHPRNADGTFENASSVMYFEANGNVGIGTTDPLSYAGPNLDIQTGGLAINGQAITYYWPSSDTIGIGDVHSGDGLRDNLVLKTRDQDRLFINGSGNVGIGTTSPGAKLEVAGDLKIGGDSNATNTRLKISGSDPTNRDNLAFDLVKRDNDEASVRIEFDGYSDQNLHSGGIRFFTRNGHKNEGLSERLIINKDGNVGIGTTSPGAKLEVKSDSIKYSDVNATANSANAWNQHGLKVRSSNNSINFIASNTVNDRKAMIQAGHADSKYANYLSTLVINPFGGNVGIGTTSPSAKLDVNGEIRARGLIQFVDSTGSNQSDPYYFYKTNGGDGNNQLRLVIQDNSDERFEIWGNGCSTSGGCGANPVRSHYFQANGKTYHSGNVGIGTTSPSYKLHVNGTAYSTGKAGALSDKRHKNTVQDLDYGLTEILQLRPVSFVWNDEKITDDGMKGVQLGLIAQEVEKVLPEVVLTQEDEAKTKAIKYSALIPPMIEAIKQQQQQIAELQAAIKDLKLRKDY